MFLSFTIGTSHVSVFYHRHFVCFCTLPQLISSILLFAIVALSWPFCMFQHLITATLHDSALYYCCVTVILTATLDAFALYHSYFLFVFHLIIAICNIS